MNLKIISIISITLDAGNESCSSQNIFSSLLPDENFEGPGVHVSDGDGGVVVGQGTLQHCPEHWGPGGQHLPCGLYPLCAGGQPNLSRK